MMALYGLIFDVDGVIADTEAVNARASIRIFEDLFAIKGVKRRDFEAGLGRGAAEYVKAAAGVHGLCKNRYWKESGARQNVFSCAFSVKLPRKRKLLTVQGDFVKIIDAVWSKIMLFKSLSGKCRLNPVMYDNKWRQSCFFRPLETILIGVAFFRPSNAAGIQDAGTHWLEIVQLEIRINAGVDDAEELNEDGDVSLDSTDLELTYDDYHGGNQTIGLRFDDVQIDRAAKIHRAHIVFTVDEAESSNPCNLTFTAQAVDSAGPFTAEPHNITGRWPTTLARVTWSPPEWGTVGSAGYDQTTPGIASVIQEIIDRPGWVRGNSIVIIVTGTGSRIAESYDGSPDDAPLLHVEFSPADTNVDFKDFAVLANDWRRTGSALAADINADNVVDSNDLKILAASWLCGCDQIESYSQYSYSLYLACNQNVADASVNTFDLETLDYFRHFIAELENTGAIDMPIPVDMQDCNDPEYCPYIYLTTQEAKRILAAKTAHAIWLDKHDVLPWKIAQYSQNELAGLFDDDLLFSRSGLQYYYFSVVDHSPSEVFSYILENDLLKNDLFSTFYAILDDLRTDFRHSNTSDENRNTAYTVREALTTYAANDRRVSRAGCHSMTRITIAMLRSINIPGQEMNNGLWYENGHSSAVLPTLQTVMPHGDYIYNGLIRATPAPDFLPTFAFYDDNLNTQPCGASLVCLSHRHMSLNALKYPADWTMSRCCDPTRYGYEDCRDYIYDEHSAYLTTQEMDAAVPVLEALCGTNQN